MITKCPECDLPISSKAVTCPHCGYPLKTAPKPKKAPAHMRLPNGFGQISMIKNRNLRNPWRAMVTVGFTEEGHPISKILKPQGYFKTYNEAYEALVEYNRNPYDLKEDINMAKLYERWSEQYFKTLKSDSSIRTITSAWAYCGSIKNMRVKDVRARHIKGVIDEGKITINGVDKYPSAGIKGRIKSLFNIMLDYAVEYEIVERNYARTFALSGDIIAETKENYRGHIPFKDEEMAILWANINVSYVEDVLIQCYMGWRPQELCLLEIVNINLDDWTIRGGLKTEAGIDRIVPIHACIRDIVRAKYNRAVECGNKYLIMCMDGQTHRGNKVMTYDKYQQRFSKIVQALGLNPDHKPHDCRKHFVTLCKKYKVDEYAIKRMIGHTITDITERVYTERGVSWLHEELAKVQKI